MTTHAATTLIDATQVAQYHVAGFLVVRQVFSADRIAALDAEDRYAEYGRTSTFHR